MSLLRDAATDPAFDADKMRAVMEMKRIWDADAASLAYKSAMHACQSEIGPIARKKWNDQNKCHYLADEDIDEVIRPIYIRHGFSLEFGSDTSPLENHYRCVCDVNHTAGHVKRHDLDAPCDDKGMKGSPNKTGVQGVMSTMTYMRRNLKVLIFNIPIKGFDKDGARKPQDDAVITLDQIATLNDWILQKDVLLDDFLQWGQVGSLELLPRSKFASAIEMLKARPMGAKKR